MPKKLLVTFDNKKAKAARMAKQYTMDAVATAVNEICGTNITRQHICKWEQGHSMPVLVSAYGLCKVLEIPFDNLMLKRGGR